MAKHNDADVQKLVEAAEAVQMSQCYDHAGASCRAWCSECQAEVAADHVLTSALLPFASDAPPAPAGLDEQRREEKR